ncbi:MAG: helix-turn-helix domain-containing protein [Deltaproteobacteria bacterium]|jgi:ribosome-binding protein aMBF1 (putative translation factor)|nr:helix-turn-helix domain-containing protein [Deltaproteobacteria bacterium]
MLALVKKPHIELSIQGDQIDELISWIKKKYDVTILTDAYSEDSIPIEETDFWKEMQSNRVGNLLAAARLKAGLTQKKLANIVGIRQSMISEYERGKRRLTSDMGKKLGSALKIEHSHLRDIHL